MVQEKTFREDLYYRLNVVRIETPPLRERMEDMPELVDFMLQRLNNKHGTGVTEISEDALNTLTKYNWPGNVRELENALHSASVVSKGKRILSKDLPANFSTPSPSSTSTTKEQAPSNPAVKDTKTSDDTAANEAVSYTHLTLPTICSV